MTDSTFTPSARVRRIRQSPSTAAAARVRELKSEGRTIHDLTVGEPDFDTPDHIKAAAIRAIEAGETKYTSVNGTPQLREAIRGHLLTTTGHRYGDSEITVGGGGKQVIFLAFMASLDPGDEVIIPAPYWVSYPDMVRANDGEPVVVATSRSDGYKLTPQLLESAITEETRWVVLNTPSNPAGVVYSASELEALGEVLARHPRVWVLTDEIYDEIHYGTEPPANFARVLPRFRDRHLLVNGVSKSYAMTGWRLGYAAGEAGLVSTINLLQSQTSSCPSSISQAAAAQALTGEQQSVRERVDVYRSRRDRAVELLEEIPGLDPIVPEGAFYIYVDCTGLIGKRTQDGSTLETDQDVTLFLLETAQVAVIQGSAYGTSPFFRMSFATDLDTIETALRAVHDAIGELV